MQLVESIRGHHPIQLLSDGTTLVDYGPMRMFISVSENGKPLIQLAEEGARFAMRVLEDSAKFLPIIRKKSNKLEIKGAFPEVVRRMIEATKKMPMVTHVEENKYNCSEPGQAAIRDAIKQNRLNRVVIAACSPRMHENSFRKTVAAAGLNPYLMEVSNLREHCSWVHADAKDDATQKAIDLIRMAVAKVSRHEALFPQKVPMTKKTLIIGGGIAGIQAALDIANAGHKVVLVEREPTIGGPCTSTGRIRTSSSGRGTPP